MAGEDRAAAETRPGQSSVDPEKAQVEDVAGHHQQSEHEGRQETERRPIVPVLQTHSTPLPPSHHDAEKGVPPPQQMSGVHFGPLPPPLPQRPAPQPINFERPYYPVWHMAKIVLGTLSLLSCAIIFGLGITLGLLNAPYAFSSYSYEPSDFELGLSGAAAGLAILVTMVEFLKLAITGRTMHPGAHVAFQLFIWLVAVVAVVFTSLYVTDWDVYYDYPGGDPENLEEKSQMYETVLLGFDCVLVFIHFVLFCGACAETNEYNKARRGTIVVEVPVPVPAGTPIPEGHLPYYMRPQTFVPQPGAQQVQYSVPMVPQVARQGPGGGSITGQSQSAAIYGGYYAPAPPNMWAPSQQHQGNAQHYQGYYAPVSAPTMTPANSARREPPVPALASSSGSRRSQRLA